MSERPTVELFDTLGFCRYDPVPSKNDYLLHAKAAAYHAISASRPYPPSLGDVERAHRWLTDNYATHSPTQERWEQARAAVEGIYSQDARTYFPLDKHGRVKERGNPTVYMGHHWPLVWAGQHHRIQARANPSGRCRVLVCPIGFLEESMMHPAPYRPCVFAVLELTEKGECVDFVVVNCTMYNTKVPEHCRIPEEEERLIELDDPEIRRLDGWERVDTKAILDRMIYYKSSRQEEFDIDRYGRPMYDTWGSCPGL